LLRRRYHSHENEIVIYTEMGALRLRVLACEVLGIGTPRVLPCEIQGHSYRG
jgi:hypothetical protein